jgi:hypothetical protein
MMMLDSKLPSLVGLGLVDTNERFFCLSSSTLFFAVFFFFLPFVVFARFFYFLSAFLFASAASF